MFDETGIGGGELHSVYMRDVDGSAAIKLGDGVGGRLSPDGRWALALLEGAPARLILHPTGAGETKFIPFGKLQSQNFAWFPDGKHVCVSANEGSGGLRLYEIEIESGAYRAFTEEGVNAIDLLVSPDGKSVAARGPDMTFKLYPVDGGEPVSLPSVTPDLRPIGWSADGGVLFAFERGKLPASIYGFDVRTGERTLHRELSPADRTGVDSLTRVTMTPDLQTIVYSFPQSLCDLFAIEGLM